LYDYNVIVNREGSYRVLDLTGNGDCGAGANRSAAGIVKPIQGIGGASVTAVRNKEPGP
jgi:hypothetical protein